MGVVMSGRQIEERLQRERQVVAPSLARYTQLHVERGAGSFLYTSDGRRVLDFVQGIAVNSLGHCHPEVVAAATRQMSRLMHGSANTIHYEPMIELAEKLAELAPGALGCSFFSNSGAEAVDGAIKLARYVTRRPGIIAFYGGFHGRTYGALSLTTSKATYRSHYEPLVGAVHRVPYPSSYRSPFGLDPDRAGEQALSHLTALLKTAVAPADVAAIVIEPVLGEGGYVVPPDGFLQEVRSLCSKHGILLIFDEIQSGMGRTGRWFACEHGDVVPDVMTLGKALGGGLPLSAVVSTPKWMAKWPPGAHGGTFGGNPVACAAGLATIGIVERDGLLDHAAAQGGWAQAELRRLQERYPVIGDVRGRGLMLAVELVQPDGTAASAQAERLRQSCLANGLMVLTCGVDGNIVRMMPPLNVSREELAEAMECLDRSLSSLD